MIRFATTIILALSLTGCDVYFGGDDSPAPDAATAVDPVQIAAEACTALCDDLDGEAPLQPYYECLDGCRDHVVGAFEELQCR